MTAHVNVVVQLMADAREKKHNILNNRPFRSHRMSFKRDFTITKDILITTRLNIYNDKTDKSYS